MNRPYVICHMVTSIDGKVTGDFLYRPECEKATDIYYEINRNYIDYNYVYDGDKFTVSIEDRGIQGPELYARHHHAVHIESLILLTDVVIGLLIDTAAYDHSFVYFRRG